VSKKNVPNGSAPITLRVLALALLAASCGRNRDGNDSDPFCTSFDDIAVPCDPLCEDAYTSFDVCRALVPCSQEDIDLGACIPVECACELIYIRMDQQDPVLPLWCPRGQLGWFPPGLHTETRYCPEPAAPGAWLVQCGTETCPNARDTPEP
jgi:hypothetical protein